MRLLTLTAAISALFLSGLAQAKEKDQGADFAEDTIIIAASPFGGSFQYSYAFSKETRVNVAIGGMPELEIFNPEIDGVAYEVTPMAVWAGAFLNHSPFEGADWFRLNSGVGFGVIDNKLEDADGNAYRVEYRETPVFYTGIGFGFQPKKGFQYGLDIGALFGGGPEVTADPNNSSDALDAINDHSLTADVLPNIQLGLGWGF